MESHILSWSMDWHNLQRCECWRFAVDGPAIPQLCLPT